MSEVMERADLVHRPWDAVLDVPLTRFGHHIRRCGVTSLAGQVYLWPHPVELC